MKINHCWTEQRVQCITLTALPPSQVGEFSTFPQTIELQLHSWRYPMNLNMWVRIIQYKQFICIVSRKKFDWLFVVWWRSSRKATPGALLQRCWWIQRDRYSGNGYTQLMHQYSGSRVKCRTLETPADERQLTCSTARFLLACPVMNGCNLKHKHQKKFQTHDCRQKHSK